jgi:ribosome-binding ATPase
MRSCKSSAVLMTRTSFTWPGKWTPFRTSKRWNSNCSSPISNRSRRRCPKPSVRPRGATRRPRLGRCQTHLAKNEPLRKLTLDVNEKKAIQSDGFLSAKPILYVCNVDEADILGKGPMVQAVRDYAKSVGAEVVPVCAKLEAELAELDPAERQEMLEASGLTEPALGILVRSAYRALGLQSYFTAGEKEVRAWTVPVGCTAPQAAGVIHTDFEKGFIRMEVYGLADLETYKTEKEIKAAGKLRVEGKAYIMQDGDICHFLFN